MLHSTIVLHSLHDICHRQRVGGIKHLAVEGPLRRRFSTQGTEYGVCAVLGTCVACISSRTCSPGEPGPRAEFLTVGLSGLSACCSCAFLLLCLASLHRLRRRGCAQRFHALPKAHPAQPWSLLSQSLLSTHSHTHLCGGRHRLSLPAHERLAATPRRATVILEGV